MDEESLPAVSEEQEPEEPVEFCPSCKQQVPLSGWFGVNLEGEGPVVCKACSVEPLFPRLPVVPSKYMELLRRVIRGQTVTSAARHVGMNPETARHVMKGRRVPEVRRAYQRLLEMHGLDLESLARKSRLLMDSTKPYWNPKEEEFEHFPDNAVQLGTVRHLARLHQLESSHMEAKQGGATVVLEIHTNLGQPTEKVVDGEYTVEFDRKDDA